MISARSQGGSAGELEEKANNEGSPQYTSDVKGFPLIAAWW